VRPKPSELAGRKRVRGTAITEGDDGFLDVGQEGTAKCGVSPDHMGNSFLPSAGTIGGLQREGEVKFFSSVRWTIQ